MSEVEASRGLANSLHWLTNDSKIGALKKHSHDYFHPMPLKYLFIGNLSEVANALETVKTG